MSVYVDGLSDHGRKGIWCHMIADSEVELHAFAKRLGLKRHWSERGGSGQWMHYDLKGANMRDRAIANGAIEVKTVREFMERCKAQVRE